MRPVFRRIRKDAAGEELLDTAAERVDFPAREQRGQRLRERGWGRKSRFEPAQIIQNSHRDRFPRKIPDDRPELWVLVECDSVVDAPDGSVFAEQEMPALAIRVVDDRIEDGNSFHLLAVAVAQREIVLTIHGIDVELDSPNALRTVAQDGWGDIRPTERRADEVRSAFSLGERASGKIPQRPLAAAGFVDGKRLVSSLGDSNEESIV